MEDQRVAAAFEDLLGDIPDDHIAAPANCRGLLYTSQPL